MVHGGRVVAAVAVSGLDTTGRATGKTVSNRNVPRNPKIPETSTPTAPTRLIPLTAWPSYHPWPTVAGLRNLVFFARANGADAWIRRVGRRVLVDEVAFMAWVASGAGTGARGAR